MGLPNFSTSALSDEHGLHAGVLETVFLDYGALTQFSGLIVTVWAYEDNTQVRAQLETDGEGRVLVIDGGASRRCALVGGALAKLAEKNNWAGLVINGCVRDRPEIMACRIGVKALGHVPRRSDKRGVGAAGVPVTFAGVTFRPGDQLFADLDGVVVLPRNP